MLHQIQIVQIIFVTERHNDYSMRYIPMNFLYATTHSSFCHLYYRRNISIGIPLDLSIPTEMTSIEPLVENEKSSKTPKKLKIMLCYIFSD